ncbi:hypothetical protein ACFSNB_08105, partial [Phaeospirillum tilakii]
MTLSRPPLLLALLASTTALTGVAWADTESGQAYPEVGSWGQAWGDDEAAPSSAAPVPVAPSPVAPSPVVPSPLAAPRPAVPDAPLGSRLRPEVAAAPAPRAARTA